MKKHLLITLSLLYSLSFSGIGQITIDHTNMPQADDTHRISIGTLDSSLKGEYEKIGANQTWDFSLLKADRQNLKQFFNSKDTPYRINGKIAEKIGDTLRQDGLVLVNVYEFYTSDSRAFVKDQRAATIETGIIPMVLDPIYSDPDEVYQFPLNYLDVDSSTFKFVFNFPVFKVYYGSEGDRINKVEGWGKVTTPFGTFNCLKVVTDIISFDSISFNNNNSSYFNYQREYKWLTRDFNIPVLTITGNVDNNVFQPVAVEYKDSIRDVPSIYVPITSFAADTQKAKVGDTVNFINNSISLNTPKYNWDIKPESFRFVNNTNKNSKDINVVFTDSGYFDVELSVSNSYGEDVLRYNNYIQVYPITGIKSFKLSEAVQINPNPLKNGSKLNLKGIRPFHQIKLYNLVGSLVYELEIPKDLDELQLMLPKLNSGNYFIQLSGDQRIQTLQLIIAE